MEPESEQTSRFQEPRERVEISHADYNLWTGREEGRGAAPELRRVAERVRELATANPVWGEQRMANEFPLKLGIQVSPRAVGRRLDWLRSCGKTSGQRWAAFVQNHAKDIIARDFPASVTRSTRRVPRQTTAVEGG